MKYQSKKLQGSNTNPRKGLWIHIWSSKQENTTKDYDVMGKWNNDKRGKH